VPRSTYELRAPQSPSEWAQYHHVRRHVLFELRGQGDSYDPNHPDEKKSGHHPLVLFRGAEVLGVVRVDIAKPVAIVRRVAIRPDRQRQGHGTALLTLVESFARDHGCFELFSHVAPDAVPFYARCGFEPLANESVVGDAPVPMRKPLPPAEQS
jgi:GNAT superfamily N-acetyltransferase